MVRELMGSAACALSPSVSPPPSTTGNSQQPGPQALWQLQSPGTWSSRLEGRAKGQASGRNS